MTHSPVIPTRLVPIEAARAQLGVDAEQIIRWADAGELAYCFNLSVRARGERRRLTVWRPCVEAMAAGQPQPACDLAAVVDDVIPEREGLLPASVVFTRLVVDRRHVRLLIEQREIQGRIVDQQRMVVVSHAGSPPGVREWLAGRLWQ